MSRERQSKVAVQMGGEIEYVVKKLLGRMYERERS